MKYTQCLLVKENIEQTSFIPTKFAVVGKIIKIRRDDKEWEDGWLVKTVGATLDEDKLPDYRKSIRQHRKNTGDNTPKIKP